MHPSEVMEAYSAAWREGDASRAWGFYADDIVLRLPGRGALSGEHRGREAVIAAMRALVERASATTPVVEVIDRLTSGERVAMVLREAFDRGGERLELRRVNVFRVVDGKIVEIENYEANQYEIDAFFT